MKLTYTPFSGEKITEFKEKILQKSQDLQNITVNFIPGTGMISLFNFLVRERKLISEYTQHQLFLFLNISKFNQNPDLELADCVNILRTLYADDISFNFNLDDYAHCDLSLFKKLVYALTFEGKYNLTFVLAESASLFYSKAITLHDLYEVLKVNPMQTSAVFLNTYEYDSSDIFKLDVLASFFTQNTTYFVASDAVSLDAYVKNQEAFLSRSYNKSFISKLHEACSYDAKTFKHGIGLANTDDTFEQKFLDTEDIYTLLNADWMNARYLTLIKNLKPSSVSYLKNSIDKPSDFLLNTGLVVESNLSYRPFNSLFADFISKYNFDTSKDITTVNTLTGIEQLVLDFLEKNEGQIVTKTDIAKILWQKEWEAKYSEWAVDKFLSRFRASLASISYPKSLKTVKSKGVILA